MTRRLIREGDPPAGQLASPVPQYWNPSTEAFEDVLGAHGAPRAILYGPNGQPISQSNPLEVRVRELEAELAAMRGMLETGNAKVTLKGRKEDVVFAREIRNTSTPIAWVGAPEQARGAIVVVQIHGVTGTFDSNQGLRLETRPGQFTDEASWTTVSLVSNAMNRIGRISHIWFPGGDLGEASSVAAGIAMAQFAGVPIQDRLYARLRITGTMDVGEGFDCEVRVLWLI